MRGYFGQGVEGVSKAMNVGTLSVRHPGRRPSTFLATPRSAAGWRSSSLRRRRASSTPASERKPVNRTCARLPAPGEALEVEILEESEDRYDFDVTRCCYAEMYREMGLGHIGHLLSCHRDGTFRYRYNTPEDAS